MGGLGRPLEPSRPCPGDRQAQEIRVGVPRGTPTPIFDGLIWLARTGRQWSQLPRRYGPKSTVHERLCAWVEHGCFCAAWAIVLEEYDQAVGINWAWQAADASMVKAPLGKRRALVRRKPRAATPPTEGKPEVNARCSPMPKAFRSRWCGVGQIAMTARCSWMSWMPSLSLFDRGYDTPACRQLAVDEGLVAHIPKKATEEQPLPAPSDPERHPARRWVALGGPQVVQLLPPDPDSLGEASRPVSRVCRVDCVPHHLAQTCTGRPTPRTFRIGF
ncbi:transposase [Deinococcus sp. QL22]|uniref:transposase n=1 Tax=Deinococcus sp. QL22 TaxID=2939437 RepID=UPI003530518D